jgi:hypothetical protein
MPSEVRATKTLAAEGRAEEESQGRAEPGLHVSAARMGRGSPSNKLQAGVPSLEVQQLAKGLGPQD